MVTPNARTQLESALMCDDPELALDLLAANGWFDEFMPEVQAIVGFGGHGTGHKALWPHTRLVVAQTPPDFVVRIAALFHDVGKPRCFKRSGRIVSFHGHELVGSRMFADVCTRFSPLFDDIKTDASMLIELLGRAENYDGRWTDSAIRRLDRDLGQLRARYVDLLRADCTSANAKKRARVYALVDDLERRMNELRKLDAKPPALPKGLGTLLCEHFDRKPGRWLGDLMDALKHRVENCELERGREAEYYLNSLMTP